MTAPRRSAGSRYVLLVVLTAPWMLAAGCGGCWDGGSSVPAGGPGIAPGAQQSPQGLLEVAVDSLNRQEEFPSGEMLVQIIDQLNQWVRGQEPPVDWRRDPALDDLPEPLGGLAALEGLDQMQFPRSDGYALQEAVWLRNVARWARGGRLDDLSQARRLFDWTVRNVQLASLSELESDQRLAQMPWETLLSGRGTAAERGWVFILLARQLGLDVALLAVPDPDDPEGGPPLAWAVGVLTGGEVYVFDPGLGLPVPGPKGIRLDESGELEIRPATLSELAEDDSLLRRLDFDRDNPYRVTSSDAGKVTALIEASPTYLARRMKLAESRLIGQRRVVLSTSATAQMGRWKQAASVTDTRLWTLPYIALLERERASQEQELRLRAARLPLYVTYAAPAWEAELTGPAPWEDEAFYQPRRTSSGQRAEDAPLWKGRVLHLKGQFTGPQGAIDFYQHARPSDEQLAGLAEHYYRIILEANNSLPEEERLPAEQLRQNAAEQADFARPLLLRAKQDASFWLGLMNFDMALIARDLKDDDAAAEHLRAAIDYLLNRTLEASPDGPWTHGANYNLARAYETTGDYDEAIAYYVIDTESPCYYGNILRARWLNQLRPKVEEQR